MVPTRAGRARSWGTGSDVTPGYQEPVHDSISPQQWLATEAVLDELLLGEDRALSAALCDLCRGGGESWIDRMHWP